MVSLFASRVDLGQTSERTMIGDAEVIWEFGDFNKEYRALRSACGLIDCSAGGPIRVSGPRAATMLQAVLARDIEFLPPEKALTSLILDPDGAVVDIVTIIAGEEDFLVLTGPGRSDAVETALLTAAQDHLGEVTIANLDSITCVIAAEGPTSWQIVASVLGSEYATLAYESVLPIEIEGTDALIGRLGVTGEYGYTLVLPSHIADRVCEEFILAGAVPAGHRARESAMFEVRQPIVHREAGAGESVLTAGLNWLVDLSKDDYTGRDRVEDDAGQDIRPIGFSVVSGLIEAGEPLFVAGRSIGTVHMLVDSPIAGGQLGLAKVPARWQAAGLDFTSASGAMVRTLAPPYVVPKSWTTTIRV